MTLNEGQLGMSIPVVNLSTFNANQPSTRREDTAQWRIVPATGERINGLPSNEELILDNAVANFTLTYTDADNGWVIL